MHGVSCLITEYSCEYGSMKFYALCGFGGVLSCGITHTAVVPLDLVKCRMQVCIGITMLKVFLWDLIPNNLKGLHKWEEFEYRRTARNLSRKPNLNIFVLISVLNPRNASFKIRMWVDCGSQTLAINVFFCCWAQFWLECLFKASWFFMFQVVIL